MGTATHDVGVDLLDDTVSLARTETGDVRKEMAVVGVADRLVDVNAKTVDDLDERLLKMGNELLNRELEFEVPGQRGSRRR